MQTRSLQHELQARQRGVPCIGLTPAQPRGPSHDSVLAARQLSKGRNPIQLQWVDGFPWCLSAKKTQTTYLFYHLGGVCLFTLPSLVWLCSLCWRHLTAPSPCNLLMWHWFVTSLEKRDTFCFLLVKHQENRYDPVLSNYERLNTGGFRKELLALQDCSGAWEELCTRALTASYSYLSHIISLILLRSFFSSSPSVSHMKPWRLAFCPLLPLGMQM